MATYLGLVLIGSIVVLIQTAAHDYARDFYWVWALLVSTVSAIACAVVFVVHILGKDTTELMHMVAAALLVLWVPGTCIMTFKDPYKATGNGYFGAWMSLAFSWLLAVQFFPSLSKPLEELTSSGAPLVGALLLASMTVFAQTVWICVDFDGACTGVVIWVLVCSGISLLITSLLLVPRFSSMAQPAFKFVVAFLLIWWSAGWFVATFDRPYKHTGNGFFGCWAALIASAMLFDSTWGINAKGQADALAGKLSRELLSVLLASVVVLIAACYASGSDFWRVWAIICSGVSLSITLVVAICMLSGAANTLAGKIPAVTLFLFCWWVLGTGMITLEAPFRVTSNGYFGAWIALVGALLLCALHSERLQALRQRAGDHGLAFAAVTIASATLLLQAMLDCGNSRYACNGNWALALVVGIISLATCIVIGAFYPKVEPVVRWIVLFLLLLWGVGVGVLTFDGPYVYTGNAYFACWGAFFACAVLCSRLFPEVARRAGVTQGEGGEGGGGPGPGPGPTTIGTSV